MPLVMLRRDWPAKFRRRIYSQQKGKKLPELIRVAEFSPGVPTEITRAEADCLKNDIGVSLLPVLMDESGRTIVVSAVDEVETSRDATDEE